MLSYDPIYNKVNVFSLKPGKQRYIVTIAGFSPNGKKVIALVAPVNALNFWEAKAKTVCFYAKSMYFRDYAEQAIKEYEKEKQND